MASDLAVPRKLWEHADPTSTHMYKFMRAAEKSTKLSFPVRAQRPFHDDTMTDGDYRITKLYTSGLANTAPTFGISHSITSPLYTPARSPTLWLTRRPE